MQKTLFLMEKSSLPGEITQLLTAVRRGDSDAESKLIALVYAEFRSRAQYYLRGERSNHTLQPTALVNEAYLRLVQNQKLDFQSRAHFFATASTVMRRVLVDHARARTAAKRFDEGQRVELSEMLAAELPRIDQMLVLDEALTRLKEMDSRQARLVEMLYFGGLTEAEAALVLGVHVRTVKREWSSARAWLQAELNNSTKDLAKKSASPD